MRKGFLLVLLFVSAAFCQVTQFGLLSSKNTDRATQMMASYYTAIKIAHLSANITVATTYPKYLLAGVYNPRRDSSVYVQLVSQAGDTVTYSIPTESPLGIKPPPSSKILSAGTSDSLIYLFQYIGNTN